MPAPNPIHYSTRDLKTKILGKKLAQTSVYLVNVTGLNSSLDAFFRQRIVGYDASIQESINLFCSETSLPGTTLATHEATNDYAGVTEKMSYRRIYDDTVDFTFYIDGEYKILSYFDAWMDYITGMGSSFPLEAYTAPQAYYRMNYPINYKTTVYITKFEKEYKQAQPALKYQFIDAFPINIVSMPVSYDASELLKCTVSFAYTRYVRSASNAPLSNYILPADPRLQAAANAAANSPGNPELRNSIDRALSPSGSGTPGFGDSNLDRAALSAQSPSGSGTSGFSDAGLNASVNAALNSQPLF